MNISYVSSDTKCLAIEINLRKTEWQLICLYNPHKNNISNHLMNLIKIIDRNSSYYDKYPLNNKHMETTVNLTIQFFESRYQRKYLVKVWSFLAHPPQNDGPVIFFVKLNENHLLMANIFKPHKYQTFGLFKMHNMSKIWFSSNKFSFRKSLVYD